MHPPCDPTLQGTSAPATMLCAPLAWHRRPGPDGDADHRPAPRGQGGRLWGFIVAFVLLGPQVVARVLPGSGRATATPTFRMPVPRRCGRWRLRWGAATPGRPGGAPAGRGDPLPPEWQHPPEGSWNLQLAIRDWPWWMRAPWVWGPTWRCRSTTKPSAPGRCGPHFAHPAAPEPRQPPGHRLRRPAPGGRPRRIRAPRRRSWCTGGPIRWGFPRPAHPS